MSTSAVSREKKRITDRKAQIARRIREKAHLSELESTAAHCRKHHNNEDVARLRDTIEKLRLENADLKHRRDAAISLLQGTTPVSDSGALAKTSEINKHEIPKPRSSAKTNAAHWQDLPVHIPHNDMTGILFPWLLYPAIVRDASDTPSGLDLLYGSHVNPLANSIHIAMICARFSTMHEPERLAFGWLMYVYVKWLFAPSPQRWALIPDFMRSTELQKTQAHPAIIDAVLWPELRDNMIRNFEQHDDRLTAALRCMSPKFVTPWPRLSPVLQPDREQPGKYDISPEFMQSFTNIQHWTISARFAQQYPELMRGAEYALQAGSSIA